MKFLLAIAVALFGKLRLCALAGGFAGSVSGGLFGIVLSGYPQHILTPLAQLYAGLALGAVAWIAVVLIFGACLRYGVSQIAAQAFVNAMLTSIFTVFLAYALHIAWLATILGILVGIVVGSILCRFCRTVEWGKAPPITPVAAGGD